VLFKANCRKRQSKLLLLENVEMEAKDEWWVGVEGVSSEAFVAF